MKGTDTLICKTISKSAVQYSIYAQKARPQVVMDISTCSLYAIN